jgi:hypothetical protein
MRVAKSRVFMPVIRGSFMRWPGILSFFDHVTTIVLVPIPRATTMRTKKKVGWLRRLDDGKLFKFWRLSSLELDSVGREAPAKVIETDLGQMESADGRRVYMGDDAEFFFEGEPNRPLRIARTHGA